VGQTWRKLKNMNAMFFAGKLLGMLVSGREPPGKVRGRRLLHERTVEAGLARYWSPHPSLPVRETSFLRHVEPNPIFSPRQARDKRRNALKKRCVYAGDDAARVFGDVPRRAAVPDLRRLRPCLRELRDGDPDAGAGKRSPIKLSAG
jgi:hypothetical protein